MDQQVLGEQVELACVVPQLVHVAVKVSLAARLVRPCRGRPGEHHPDPALDPALQRSALIRREIVPGADAQQLEDALQRIGACCLRRLSMRLGWLGGRGLGGEGRGGWRCGGNGRRLGRRRPFGR